MWVVLGCWRCSRWCGCFGCGRGRMFGRRRRGLGWCSGCLMPGWLITTSASTTCCRGGGRGRGGGGGCGGGWVARGGDGWLGVGRDVWRSEAGTRVVFRVSDAGLVEYDQRFDGLLSGRGTA